MEPNTNNNMKFENWQLWGKRPEDEMKYNAERIKGNLPEMESTKQLVKLVSEFYRPGMRILDVGCNVGHYLIGLRKKFPDMEYTGVDAYEHYIRYAKDAFANDKHAHFEVKDLFKPLFPNTPFDIVYCCNVILHLPDFRVPLKNLLSSTKHVCFVRTLLADNTSVVKIPEKPIFDDVGNPLDYYYYNTWQIDYFSDYVNKLGWKVTLIKDEFDPAPILKEHETAKERKGTRIVDGRQVIGNVIANWVWAKMTPSS